VEHAQSAKEGLIHHDATPKIVIDPETDDVTSNAITLTRPQFRFVGRPPNPGNDTGSVMLRYKSRPKAAEAARAKTAIEVSR